MGQLTGVTVDTLATLVLRPPGGDTLPAASS